jgi:hypothetical protein
MAVSIKTETFVTTRKYFTVKISRAGLVSAGDIAREFAEVPENAGLCGFDDNNIEVTFKFRHETVETRA